MMKLFRKIRKRLAAENKPIEYLKYAVGEIFLLVIGILIALQINTWNEQRKREQVREKLIQTLISDFEVTKSRTSVASIEAGKLNQHLLTFMKLAVSGST